MAHESNAGAITEDRGGEDVIGRRQGEGAELSSCSYFDQCGVARKMIAVAKVKEQLGVGDPRSKILASRRPQG